MNPEEEFARNVIALATRYLDDARLADLAAEAERLLAEQNAT